MRGRSVLRWDERLSTGAVAKRLQITSGPPSGLTALPKSPLFRILPVEVK